jgi:hypothetical protein
MAKTAFVAKFRIIANPTPPEKRNEYTPEENIVVNFTPEQAMAAANYLMTMAEQAEAKGTKIRTYTGKDEFTEQTGFSLWGGKWGNKGSFAPLQPESPETSF